MPVQEGLWAHSKSNVDSEIAHKLETNNNLDPSINLSGYMSPEYAISGMFSVKSDVFSFGVLLLEIIGGKKNTAFQHSETMQISLHM